MLTLIIFFFAYVYFGISGQTQRERGYGPVHVWSNIPRNSLFKILHFEAVTSVS